MELKRKQASATFTSAATTSSRCRRSWRDFRNRPCAVPSAKWQS